MPCYGWVRIKLIKVIKGKIEREHTRRRSLKENVPGVKDEIWHLCICEFERKKNTLKIEDRIYLQLGTITGPGGGNAEETIATKKSNKRGHVKIGNLDDVADDDDFDDDDDDCLLNFVIT